MTERQAEQASTFVVEVDWATEEVPLPHYEYEGIGVVSVKTVTTSGHATSWPVLRVTGALHPLAIWLCDEYCGGDWQAANELLGTAQPASLVCEHCGASTAVDNHGNPL